MLIDEHARPTNIHQHLKKLCRKPWGWRTYTYSILMVLSQLFHFSSLFASLSPTQVVKLRQSAGISDQQAVTLPLGFRLRPQLTYLVNRKFHVKESRLL